MQYKVQSGDTLSKIADFLLGDPSLGIAIARANNIPAPYAIEVDQVLNVPENLLVKDLGPQVTIHPAAGTVQIAGPFGLPRTIYGIPTNYLLVGAALLLIVPLFFGKK